jgi:putative transposase
MQYRWAFVAGGRYFFTVTLLERDKSLLTDHIDLLKTAFRKVKLAHPFDIDAIVVLPDHLHTIWTLPENDFDFATRWRLIKSHFLAAYPLPNESIIHENKNLNVVYGNADIGSI